MGFNNGYDSGYCDAKAELEPKITALEKKIAELEAGGGSSSQTISLSPPIVFFPEADIYAPDNAENVVTTGPNYPTTIFEDGNEFTLASSAFSLVKDTDGPEGTYLLRIAVDSILQHFPHENQMVLMGGSMSNNSGLLLEVQLTVNGTPINEGNFLTSFDSQSNAIFIAGYNRASGYTAEMLISPPA